jgi:hypothetical protein
MTRQGRVSFWPAVTQTPRLHLVALSGRLSGLCLAGSHPRLYGSARILLNELERLTKAGAERFLGEVGQPGHVRAEAAI